jgi:hypothetical protein
MQSLQPDLNGALFVKQKAGVEDIDEEKNASFYQNLRTKF